MDKKITKSDDQWRKELSPQQFNVARKKGTEPAFTGEYWDCHDKGIYKCVCCGSELFKSETKFDSGTGWPSFFEAIDPKNIKTDEDSNHGMRRTEVTCNQCDAHLGHLFPDGPAPTNLRYCINSASLRLEKKS